MSTSIKLPEDLKRRVARVVKDTEQSAHAFMVEAIRQETERAGARFLADATAHAEFRQRPGLRAGRSQGALPCEVARQENAQAEVALVAEVVVTRHAEADLARLVDFLAAEEPAAALATYDLVLGALEVLRTYPSIGRPVDGILRELVISRGNTGYLALYEHDEQADRVIVLALRHQRELGY
jgi:plasmid stabilization system protein ParE